MGRREDNKTSRREQIIGAARKLMRSRNASGFSMRTLAEVAGVSIATPYNLFGSKEAIVAAVMDADLEDFQRALLSDATDPIETLFRIITLTAEIFETEPGFYKAGASALQAETDVTLINHFGLPRHNLIRDLVVRAVQEGFLDHAVNPDSLAIALGQQFFGWIQAWARDRLSPEEMVTRSQYAFAMSLAAFSTMEHRDAIMRRVTEIQNSLPESWQAKLNLVQAGR